MAFDLSGSEIITAPECSMAFVKGLPQLSGFAGNFWAMTWGLNYLVGNNLVIRPELRYDWFSQDLGNAAQGVGLPFGKTAGGLGTQSDQFYGGCDVIWQF